MAGKKIKFALKMKDDVEVRSLQELREAFDLNQTVAYLLDGKLEAWLLDRYYEDLVKKISSLDKSDPELKRKLCEIFEVEYVDDSLSVEEIEERRQRIKKLKEITDDEAIIRNVDKVAFSQEELADLLDEGLETIYLCGTDFHIPASKKGIRYIGIETKLEITKEEREKYQANDIELIDLLDNLNFSQPYRHESLLVTADILGLHTKLKDSYPITMDQLIKLKESNLAKYVDLEAMTFDYKTYYKNNTEMAIDYDMTHNGKSSNDYPHEVFGMTEEEYSKWADVVGPLLDEIVYNRKTDTAATSDNLPATVDTTNTQNATNDTDNQAASGTSNTPEPPANGDSDDYDKENKLRINVDGKTVYVLRRTEYKTVEMLGALYELGYNGIRWVTLNGRKVDTFKEYIDLEEDDVIVTL